MPSSCLLTTLDRMKSLLLFALSLSTTPGSKDDEHPSLLAGPRGRFTLI